MLFWDVKVMLLTIQWALLKGSQIMVAIGYWNLINPDVQVPNLDRGSVDRISLDRIS
jgi:hypothetical protein